jgi:hypothetical protein
MQAWRLGSRPTVRISRCQGEPADRARGGQQEMAAVEQGVVHDFSSKEWTRFT